MIVVEIVCLWTVDVYHYGGYVPLVVTMCHWLNIHVLLGVLVYHWIVVVLLIPNIGSLPLNWGILY
jgi:hypothetical protein